MFYLLAYVHCTYAVENFLFLRGEPLASCNFFTEMNLQCLNITEDTLKNDADFSTFVSGFPKKYGPNTIFLNL